MTATRTGWRDIERLLMRGCASVRRTLRRPGRRRLRIARRPRAVHGSTAVLPRVSTSRSLQSGLDRRLFRVRRYLIAVAVVLAVFLGLFLAGEAAGIPLLEDP